MVYRDSGINIGYWVVAGLEKVNDYISCGDRTCTWRRYRIKEIGYMAAFFRQVKIGVLTLTLEKKQ